MDGVSVSIRNVDVVVILGLQQSGMDIPAVYVPSRMPNVAIHCDKHAGVDGYIEIR